MTVPKETSAGCPFREHHALGLDAFVGVGGTDAGRPGPFVFSVEALRSDDPLATEAELGDLLHHLVPIGAPT